MYQQHFGISENPFSITPDPRFLYMSARYQEALAHLLYGVSESGGFVLLSGEVGTGKTTTCRCLLEQLPNNVDVALVLNPRLSEVELLSTICDELGIDHPVNRHSMKAYNDAINAHLLQAHANGRRSVLIIDEAQNLTPAVLEQVRLLTNLETATTKLLQIILVGQPELNELLARPSLRQLAQRITARFHLNELEPEELRSYVDHRLRVSGIEDEVFTDRALEVIHRYSRGIPRLVNSICDRCLLGAYTQNLRRVDHHLATVAASEVLGHDAVPDAKQASKKLWAARQDAEPKKKLEPEPPLFDVMSDAHLDASDKPARSSVWPAIAAFFLAIMLGSAFAVIDPMEVNVIPEESRQQIIAKIKPLADNLGLGKFLDAPRAQSEATEPRTDAATDAKPDTLREETSLDAGYQTLFSLWGHDFGGLDGVAPCAKAETVGLSCLHDKGSFRALALLDRPVLITLLRPAGQTIDGLESTNGILHGVITGLDDGAVTMRFGDTVVTLMQKDIMTMWDRSYMALWQAPPFYQRDLTLGMEGQDVAWVKVRMAEINGETPNAQKIALFDEALLQEVKTFQASHHIYENGTIGPETLMVVQKLSGLRKGPSLSGVMTSGQNRETAMTGAQ